MVLFKNKDSLWKKLSPDYLSAFPALKLKIPNG